MTAARIEPRFATFLEGHRPDPKARARLLVGATVAIAAVAVAGTLGWTAEKLGVKAVAGPTSHYAITIDFAPPPPPVAAPPRQPTMRGGSGTPDASEPEEPKPSKPDELSPEHTVKLETPREGPVGEGPSNPFADPFGKGPACAVPPCSGTSTIGVPGIDRVHAPPPRTPPSTPPILRPVEVVKGHGIFTPDPSRKELSRTQAGVMGSTRTGVSSVSFCVTPGGTTTDVKTVKRFPGDPAVDAICRATVARWRFRAFLVDGRPRKTCTTTAFQIEFE